METKKIAVNKIRNLVKQIIKEEYGDKRDYKKIDIFVKGKNGEFDYISSTTWAKNKKEAKDKFLSKYPNYKSDDVEVEYSENVQ